MKYKIGDYITWNNPTFQGKNRFYSGEVIAINDGAFCYKVKVAEKIHTVREFQIKDGE